VLVRAILNNGLEDFKMLFLKDKFQPIIILVVVIWAVEIVNFILGHGLTNWGILPRSITGLIGIPLAPFIHGGFWHTVSNTIPIIILGGLTLVSSEKRFWSSTIGAILLTGILVWIFARSSYHVGASGLVFAYFGILMGRAFIERSFVSVITAFVTVTLYGGILWGIFPIRSYVSFESHLFGLIAGFIVVWLDSRNGKAQPR
jgi:membrane associated rhomboid family serine protease